MANFKLKQQEKTAHKVLSVWFIHDQRPGHINQLKGLAKRLKVHSEAKNTQVIDSWFDAKAVSFSWKELLLKKSNDPHQIKPDIVIAAGHSTHKLLLQAAHVHQAFSVVLMKPSLPLFLFNAIICPQHDHIKRKANDHIFESSGALNNITPPELSLTKTTEKTCYKTKHLMLMGGPSKHFMWNENSLINEIKNHLPT